MSRLLSWFRWWRGRRDSQHPVSSLTERLRIYEAGR